MLETREQGYTIDYPANGVVRVFGNVPAEIRKAANTLSKKALKSTPEELKFAMEYQIRQLKAKNKI